MAVQCLGAAQQRGGQVFDDFGVQLRDRADLQESAAGILVLDSDELGTVVIDFHNVLGHVLHDFQDFTLHVACVILLLLIVV